uniref:LAM_G_DOMAIN domain-containing protein n=1 Tax=Haemonchus placei TaxID=6290 RepID=A0A0N4WNV7_HAEPC
LHLAGDHDSHVVVDHRRSMLLLNSRRWWSRSLEVMSDPNRTTFVRQFQHLRSGGELVENVGFLGHLDFGLSLSCRRVYGHEIGYCVLT